MVGQKGLRHRVMSAPPRARLIVIHPQFALGLFERGLDRPAQAAHAYEGGECRRTPAPRSQARKRFASHRVV
jgi:hypothetical protein